MSKAASSSVRYPSPARTSPATSVDLPDPEAPGTSTPVPPASTAPAWNSRCVAARLRRRAVDVPHDPSDGVAVACCPCASSRRRARRRRCRRRGPTTSTSTSARRVRSSSGSRSPASSRVDEVAQTLVVGAHREAVGQRPQARRAVRPPRCADHRAQAESPALPASCASVGPAAAGLGVRLAQCCMAHPPATSAAPISGVPLDVEPGERQGLGRAGGRRWRPVGPVAAVVTAGGPVAVVPALVDTPVVVPPAATAARRAVPDMVAPAAGLAVRISGTTQAAAPARGDRGHAPERLAPRERAAAPDGDAAHPLCPLLACMSTADPSCCCERPSLLSVYNQWFPGRPCVAARPASHSVAPVPR